MCVGSRGWADTDLGVEDWDRDEEGLIESDPGCKWIPDNVPYERHYYFI